MVRRLSAGESLGQKLRTCRVAGFILTEIRFPGELSVPSHYHDNAFFRLMVEGLSTDTSATRTFSGGAATMIYHPAGERHAGCWHVGGRAFNIELASPQPRLQDHAAALGRPADFLPGSAVQLAQRILREFRHPDTVAPLALEAQILELIAGLCRSASSRTAKGPPGWLGRVRELLHDRCTEALSLDEIAAAAGVHPGHVARMFRRYYSTTPGQYVRHLRVQRACCALKTSDRPLADLAAELGFFDQSHFSGVFRRHTGLTPRAYRRAFRER
jgi:AraC family transcriptional regulator